jgi:hypothetical protein
MSEFSPRIRIEAPNGYVLVRDGLSLCFYMRRPHAEMAQAVARSLDAYLRAVEPHALALYADDDGYWQELDDSGWERIRHEMLHQDGCFIRLRDASRGEERHHFYYHGKPLDDPSLRDEPDEVCALSFWLPTEYLLKHGPGRLRELALELAAPLPFCSGHAGLSFIGEVTPSSVRSPVRELAFRHPGLDIPDMDRTSWTLGTRIRGIHWLNFLGQPVLGELGGAAGLRSRLSTPGTVQEMEGERVVITLGPRPEAGDTEQGLTLPAWRELARVLEPWLHHREHEDSSDFSPEELRRWERRFLD